MGCPSSKSFPLNLSLLCADSKALHLKHTLKASRITAPSLYPSTFPAPLLSPFGFIGKKLSHAGWE